MGYGEYIKTTEKHQKNKPKKQQKTQKKTKKQINKRHLVQKWWNLFWVAAPEQVNHRQNLVSTTR